MLAPDPVRQANYTIEDVFGPPDGLVADLPDELVLDEPFEIKMPIETITP